MLSAYFETFHLSSEWNPVKQWRRIALQERPSRVHDGSVGDRNKVANFTVQYCTEMLNSAGGAPKHFQQACSECPRAIENALRHRGHNLSSIVEVVARELSSSSR
jgi:hypothetical protein